MFNLPIEIQRVIFAFDTTHRKNYRRVLYELEFVTPFWILRCENLLLRPQEYPQTRLYHKQAENLIKFNRESFKNRTTELICVSLLDIYPHEYFKIFTTIRHYKWFYKNLAKDRELFHKETMGYINNKSSQSHPTQQTINKQNID
jgi:hypothetical protein